MFVCSYAKGLDCYNQGDYCQAIHQFNKALSLCPDFVQYLVDRAECYFALCDLQSAIVNYRRVCLLQPQSTCYQFRLAAVYYFQAESFFEQNLYSEALESFSRSSELKPDNIGCQYRRYCCDVYRVRARHLCGVSLLYYCLNSSYVCTLKRLCTCSQHICVCAV